MTDNAGRIFLVLVFSALTACNGKEQKHTPATMDPPDTSKPFALMTLEEREALRAELGRRGLYDCCIEPGCTECIADHGECHCHVDIRRDDPICGECLKGYKQGQGKLKMISIPRLERIRKESQGRISSGEDSDPPSATNRQSPQQDF